MTLSEKAEKSPAAASRAPVLDRKEREEMRGAVISRKI